MSAFHIQKPSKHLHRALLLPEPTLLPGLERPEAQLACEELEADEDEQRAQVKAADRREDPCRRNRGACMRVSNTSLSTPMAPTCCIHAGSLPWV